jgi:hypothetical protein
LPSAFRCTSAPGAVTPLHGPSFAVGPSHFDRRAEENPGGYGG